MEKNTENFMESNGNKSLYIPQEMILEILKRVRLDTLHVCRLASKEWNNLTYGSGFRRQYPEKTGIAVSGYFIQAYDKRKKRHSVFVSENCQVPEQKLSLNFLPEEVKIEAVSNEQGLVHCISSEYSIKKQRYYICKPTTQEWMKLPNPKTKFSTCKSALVVLKSRPLHYKIIRLSEPIRQNPKRFFIYCEVYDSKNGAWKRLSGIKLPLFSMLLPDKHVYVNGILHWLTTYGEVLTFDVKAEKWNIFLLPQQVLGADEDNQSCYWKKLVKFEGKFALLDRKAEEEKMELWVMENYKNKTWEMRGIVDACSAIDFYATDVALLSGYDSVTWYNFQQHTFTDTKLNKFFFPHNVFPFQSDFEPVFFARDGKTI